MGLSRRPAIALAVGALLATGGCGGAPTPRFVAGAGPGPVVPDEPAPKTLPAERSYAPWPMALHDPRHSGASPARGPRQGGSGGGGGSRGR